MGYFLLIFLFVTQETKITLYFSVDYFYLVIKLRAFNKRERRPMGSMTPILKSMTVGVRNVEAVSLINIHKPGQHFSLFNIHFLTHIMKNVVYLLFLLT